MGTFIWSHEVKTWSCTSKKMWDSSCVVCGGALVLACCCSHRISRAWGRIRNIAVNSGTVWTGNLTLQPLLSKGFRVAVPFLPRAWMLWHLSILASTVKWVHWCIPFTCDCNDAHVTPQLWRSKHFALLILLLVLEPKSPECHCLTQTNLVSQLQVEMGQACCSIRRQRDVQIRQTQCRVQPSWRRVCVGWAGLVGVRLCAFCRGQTPQWCSTSQVQARKIYSGVPRQGSTVWTEEKTTKASFTAPGQETRDWAPNSKSWKASQNKAAAERKQWTKFCVICCPSKTRIQERNGSSEWIFSTEYTVHTNIFLREEVSWNTSHRTGHPNWQRWQDFGQREKRTPPLR